MDTYGLIGFPLGHSFSASYFTQKFTDLQLQATYKNFEIPSIEQLPHILATTPHLRGLNVTIPYKEAIIPYLNALSEEARTIGAVNVVKITWQNRQPYLKGYNADSIGFKHSISPRLQSHHCNALILGTGGASKAVLHGLHQLGIHTQYVSRTPKPDCIKYEEITPSLLQSFTVLVNCTPVGMFPHSDEAPALPYHALSDKHLLYDLIYNPLETSFMKQGAARGATTKNGLEMLHLQAEASWNFWNE